MKIGLYLKELRLKNNLTTKQVEVKTGISNSYISLIERNKRKPSAEILSKLAKAYQVKAEDLLRLIGYLPPIIKTKYGFQQIPIYNIAAIKKPFLISENIEGYSPLPPGLESYSTKDFFAIRVKDKNMTCKRIEEGDILIIKKQSKIEKGAIALISLNNEITTKRVVKQDKHIILQSTDLEHLPILVKETDDFGIIGKVEWVIHKF
ncbi:MAG: LexA family transcriptional regulator [Actinobacteria bacterium]|nr:LexA family transcriptional regulator [Actinomycetota bacterium]